MAIVPFFRIQRTTKQGVVFAISGRLDAENVTELCKLIDAEPAGAVVALDLTNLVLAAREAVRHLRDYATDGRIEVRNCPAYIRAWMAEEDPERSA
jgi:hypothetical protein